MERVCIPGIVGLGLGLVRQNKKEKDIAQNSESDAIKK